MTQAAPSDAPAARIDALSASAELFHSTCGSGKLVWQRWSTPDAGPPLLLLHGGFGSWNHWFANIDALRQRRELWTLDMPGLGASADVFRKARAEHLAAIIAPGLKTHLQGRALDIAGFSFGAMVAVHLATAFDCRRLFAIGAAGCGTLHVQVPLEAPPRSASPSPHAAHGPVTPEAEQVHRRNLRNLMFSPHSEIDSLAVQLQADNLARARFNSRPLSLTKGFLDALPALDAELIGIWGSEDATAGGTAGIEKRRQLFVQAQPSSRFHVLEDVGHWAMYEAPERVNKLLLEERQVNVSRGPRTLGDPLN